MTHDHAGIYFFGLPPSTIQIAALAEGAEVATENHGKKISFTWPDVTLTITINTHWNRQVQLDGIRGWLSRFPEEERTAPVVLQFLAGIDQTTTCYGSKITPAYDHGGKVSRLLKSLLADSGGFFFSHQSFYNAQSKRIVGLPGDPDALGAK